MSATAANLMERVLPQTGLRQWVLTFPFAWRRRLAQDGALLGMLTRIFVETVHTFYAARAAREGNLGAKTVAITAVQRTSSDMRLNPHLHAAVLDGAWYEQGSELCPTARTSHEAARGDQRAHEHRPLPRCGGRKRPRCRAARQVARRTGKSQVLRRQVLGDEEG